MLLKSPLPVAVQRQRQLRAQGFAHAVHALRVDHVQLLGNVGLGRQRQQQLFVSRVQRRVAQHLAQGLQHRFRQEVLVKNGLRAYGMCAECY